MNCDEGQIMTIDFQKYQMEQQRKENKSKRKWEKMLKKLEDYKPKPEKFIDLGYLN